MALSRLDPLLDLLPDRAQYALRSPLAAKLLVALVAYNFLKHTNSALSRWTLNNWQSASRAWDPATELVLITGGCSGIGKQIVEDLAKRGVKMVVLDINEPKFKLPPNVYFYKADITSSTSIAEVASSIRAAHGDPTVLVNNAGVGFDGTILDEPEALIRKTFEVNTISHFLMVKEFLPAMIRHDHGHVVTIASMASFVALGEMADYACSKASALAFHESLTQELRYWYNATKVRTSVVHPLWVRTPMTKQLTDAGPRFRQPVLSPEVVSAAVVKQIVNQTSGQVILPARLTVYSLVRALPIWLQETARGIGSRVLKDLRDAHSQ